MIRPHDYYELIQSDKAFAPSTARHINQFNFTCEVVTLLLFIPQIRCVFSESYCGVRGSFSMIQSSLLAIHSTSKVYQVLGRFRLGLTYLRVFGLIRHWKQMWINSTFDTNHNNQEKCK